MSAETTRETMQAYVDDLESGRIKALRVYSPMELLLGQISEVEDRAVQRV